MNQKTKQIGLTALSIAIPVFLMAQGSGNEYDLTKMEGSIKGQKGAIRDVVSAIVGIIFLAGLVHVVLAFVNHSQNLKQIVMSYVGAFIAFAAVWAFLGGA